MRGAGRVDLTSRAGDRVRGLVDGDVIGGDRGEELASAVGRIAENVNLLVTNTGIRRDKFHAAGHVTVHRAGRFGQDRCGDQARVGLDDDVVLEPVDLLLPTLVSVAGVPINSGNDPVHRDPTRNFPPPIRPIRPVRRLDILPGDQREQRDRLLFLLGQQRPVDTRQQLQRVGDKLGDKFIPGGAVSQAISGFPGLA